jgi:hypothetical protein
MDAFACRRRKRGFGLSNRYSTKKLPTTRGEPLHRKKNEMPEFYKDRFAVRKRFQPAALRRAFAIPTTPFSLRGLRSCAALAALVALLTPSPAPASNVSAKASSRPIMSQSSTGLALKEVQAAPDTRPQISVQSNGDGSFRVSGFGFLPNTTVFIRVVDDALTQRWFTQGSTADGRLDFPTGRICVFPGRLHFSANDGRSDNTDVTGVLWSNTVDSTCPV